MDEEKQVEQPESTPSEESTDVEPAVEEAPAAEEAEETPAEPEAPEPEAPVETERPTREERRAHSLSNRLREQAQEAEHYRQQLLARPDYKPVDYEKDYQFDDPQATERLKRDREAAAALAYQQGMETASTLSQVERFTDRLEDDYEYVTEKFDLTPDMFDRLEAKYLERVGARQSPDGRIVLRDTSVRFRKFVKDYIEDLERYADSRNADTAKNVAKQRGQAAVRPSGQARKGTAINAPEDIWKLSDEEYEKRRPQLLAEISRSLEK